MSESKGKLAAMEASRNKEAPSQQASSSGAAPKRDKFAALASRGGDKLAAMSRAVEDKPPAAPVKEEKPRKKKEDHIWEDLDQAEAMTVKLLRIARDSADTLSNLETSPHLALQFAETLKKLHSKLAPHAKSVVAYESSTDHAFYHGRVEERLAKTRESIMQEWCDLEKIESTKRARDDEDADEPSQKRRKVES